MSELRPARRARANAFDLTRTDRDDVDTPGPVPPMADLLPRMAPQERVSAEAADRSTGSSAGATSATRPAAPARLAPKRERPRGLGGRVAGEQPVGITATAARVPVGLYVRAEDLVKGSGRPSWGQLIAWTCSTRQDEVVDEVVSLLRPAQRVLAPRGQNKQGMPATQITPRFTAAERAVFNQARATAQHAVDTRLDEPADVTATAVVIASLTVAARGDTQS